jgi:hypothetical protein
VEAKAKFFVGFHGDIEGGKEGGSTEGRRGRKGKTEEI